MMRTLLCGLALIGAASPAAADGFATRDLQSVTLDPSGFVGGAFEAKATSPARLTAFCPDCEAFVAVDIQIGRSTDGTEARFRSGETTVEKMAAICRSRDPGCVLTRRAFGPAVGWRTTYSAGSTILLFLDGDTLTIRSLSDDPEIAAANAVYALEAVGPQVIGAE